MRRLFLTIALATGCAADSAPFGDEAGIEVCEDIVSDCGTFDSDLAQSPVEWDECAFEVLNESMVESSEDCSVNWAGYGSQTEDPELDIVRAAEESVRANDTVFCSGRLSGQACWRFP